MRPLPRRWPDGLLDDVDLADTKAGKVRMGKPWEHFLHRNFETLTTIAA
ncbi:hypothetical protein SAMN05216374_2671 [Tardiphaga sp. OK246]|jgi:hypothetical protein|nr:hypothetical protein SAMN05216374_2671 [Tardiphaga sp. OK246]